ncbi:hypothetical protein CWI42_080990 [Ordospora colligata]|nr:hypothetical protein CWI40_081000 [Ordospora colligata]TBU18262.1 hypothetical protein CWI42_080990 [Ordospora colligata]
MFFKLLWISFFIGKYLAAVCDKGSKRAFNIKDDGVMLLNIMHRKHPLMILGTHHEDDRKHFVAMLTEISDSTIENQVFNLAYQATSKNIWLRLKKDPCITVTKSGSSLEGVKQDDEASSSLFLYNTTNDHTQFQIVSDDLCLTVVDNPDEPYTYDGINGMKLYFNPCDVDNKKQIFTIVSSLRGSIYLHPELEKDTHLVKKAANGEDMTKRIVKYVEINKLKSRL